MRRLFLTRVKVMNGAGGLRVRKFSTPQPPLSVGWGPPSLHTQRTSASGLTGVGGFWQGLGGLEGLERGAP